MNNTPDQIVSRITVYLSFIGTGLFCALVYWSTSEMTTAPADRKTQTPAAPPAVNGGANTATRKPR